MGGALGRAIEAEESAARRAMAGGAYVEAAQRWERVLDLLASAPDPARQMTALLGLGEAHNEGGHEREARAAFLRGIETAREDGSPVALARAVLGYCSDRVRVAPPPEHRALLAESLSGLDEHLVSPRAGDARGAREEATELRTLVLARLAIESYWTEPIETVRRLADEAWAAATGATDSTRLLAWQAVAWGQWVPASTPQLLDVCTAYLADAQATGDRRHEQLARRLLVEPLAELGRLDDAADQAARAVTMADELQLSVQQWVSRVVAASVQILRGDLAEAERLADEALALGTLAEPDTALDYVSVLLWTLRWLQGRLDELLPMVHEIASAPGVDATRRLGLAATLAIVGRVDEASEILDEMTPDGLRSMHMDSSWYIAMAAAAECVAVTRHEGAAAEVHELLSPFADRIALTSISATGPVAYHLGVCADVLGRVDEAERLFARAERISDEAGMPGFAARAREARAALQQRREVAGGVPATEG